MPNFTLSTILFSTTSCSEGRILPGMAQVAHTKRKLKLGFPRSMGGKQSHCVGLVICAPDLYTGGMDWDGMGRDGRRDKGWATEHVCAAGCAAAAMQAVNSTQAPIQKQVSLQM